MPRPFIDVAPFELNFDFDLKPMFLDPELISASIQDAKEQARAMSDQAREMAQQAADQAREAAQRGRSALVFAQDSAGNGSYSSGLNALQQRQYDKAIAAFDRAIAQKSERADAALYWLSLIHI